MNYIPKASQAYAGNPGRRGGVVDYCRVCGGNLFTVLDLGHHPFANQFAHNPSDPVETYPLSLVVCAECSTAQLSYCADDHLLYKDYKHHPGKRRPQRPLPGYLHLPGGKWLPG